MSEPNATPTSGQSANAATGNVAQPTQTNPQAPPAATGVQYKDWDAVLETLDAAAVELYQGSITGLKSALSSERQARKDVTKQLKAAQGKLEKGSAAEEQVSALLAQLEVANIRVSFMEEASNHSVSNSKLLWLAVSQSGESVEVGKLDWTTLRSDYPELFKTAQASANAGAGAGTSPVGQDMNKMIRQASGRAS